MRAFLWCNGEKPDKEIISNLGNISPLFGVDGGGTKAKSFGFDVKEILGDLDSVVNDDQVTKTTLLENQNLSDLTKAINELEKRGFSEFDILGVDGGDTGHILGIWGSLAEISENLVIRLHHQNSTTHRITTELGNFKIDIDKNRLFSIFALTKCQNVCVKGAEWEIFNEEFDLSTKGLHNRGLGNTITITVEGILVLIIQN
jgi:thiamine pyrophosphokinase